MARIEMKDQEIMIDGVSSNTIVSSLTSAGVRQENALNLLGYLYLGFLGDRAPAPFHFSTDVEESDAHCDADFARTFEHADWVDGESRVQAGMTPEELGFNARFHAIENDLDAIAAEFEKFSACVGAIRADLFGVVGELEDKITDLQNQIHNLKKDEGGGGTVFQPGFIDYLGMAEVGDKNVMVTRLGDKIRMTEVVEEMITSGRAFTGAVYAPGFSGGGPLVDNPAMSGAGGPIVLPQDSVLFTSAGLGTPSGRPLEARDVVGFANALADRVDWGAETRIADAQSHGDPLVRTAAEGLDANATMKGSDFVNAATDKVVGGLPAADKKRLKKELLSGEAAKRTGGALVSSGVDNLTEVKSAEAEALGAAGFGRIGSLAGATPAEVGKGLKDAGVSLPPERIRAAIGAARVARSLRG